MSAHLGLGLLAGGIGLLGFVVLRDLLGRRAQNASRVAVGKRARVVARLAGPTLTLALLGAAASWWLARLPVMTLLAAAAGGYLPSALRRTRAARHAREREQAWPAALSQLADALEGGLAFPAAAAFTARSVPTVLRGQFSRFYEAIRGGRLEQGLDELAAAPERAAATTATLLRASFVDTPTGRVAPMLRELAGVLRERWELRERARGRALSLHREAAILALSPIAFLLLIGSSAPGYLNAYRTVGGTLVSVAGAVVIGGCYLAMRRLGRIPQAGGNA